MVMMIPKPPGGLVTKRYNSRPVSFQLIRFTSFGGNSKSTMSIAAAVSMQCSNSDVDHALTEASR
eukprot:9444791-Karenia_brevis.AAC.1